MIPAGYTDDFHQHHFGNNESPAFKAMTKISWLWYQVHIEGQLGFLHLSGSGDDLKSFYGKNSCPDGSDATT
jgi:hypothetical protein